jgi:3'-phosphoadenosine 5'-phosphosulfate sulfotransferase (PAPS reductase)/FAD synthetase
VATLRDALAAVGDSAVRHIVNISGGKDSAALALFLKDRFPQIPAEYVFCDTGCELDETYEYLEKLEAYLGKRIERLNALDNLKVERKQGRTPFDYWLNEVYSGFLPTPQARWCTRVLKIMPFERHVGQDRAFSYIGIRADEDREGYIGRKPPVFSQLPNIAPVYPFKDEGLKLQDIHQILEDANIGLPSYYRWRTRSGCFFCFYQQVGEWQGLKKEHPDKFEKAKKYEKVEPEKRYTWVQGRSLEELERLEKSYPLEADREGCAICHL